MSKIYVITLDAGHGGSDPGAIGKRSHEADINLFISQLVGKILTEQGHKVVQTRTSNITLSLQQRADISNRNGCDAFISIHCNAFTNINAHGTETYNFPDSIEGEKLSESVQTELIKATGLADRGTKEAMFGVLRMTKATAILVETAFISNVNEENLLMQNDFRQKIAESIVRGLFKYLNLTYKENILVKPVVDNKIMLLQKVCNRCGIRGADDKSLTEDGLNGTNTEAARIKLIKYIADVTK